MAKKGARKTGGGTGARNTRNGAMAARLKGVERTTMNCPICHKSIPNGRIPHPGCGPKREAQ